jgi:DNA-binding HxlR family transcriptional regulator
MEDCQINDSCVPTLKLLGDFWTLRIIDALSPGEQRYCELQRAVGGLNPVTLTTRLKKLETAQLIGRLEESKAEVKYHLTPLGREALPVITAMNNFSAKAGELN